MSSMSFAYSSLSLSKSLLLQLRVADTRFIRQYTSLSQSSSESEGGIGKVDADVRDELVDELFIRVVPEAIKKPPYPSGQRGFGEKRVEYLVTKKAQK